MEATLLDAGKTLLLAASLARAPLSCGGVFIVGKELAVVGIEIWRRVTARRRCREHFISVPEESKINHLV